MRDLIRPTPRTRTIPRQTDITMRYSVGFQLYENGEEPFSEIVRAYRDSISEVFFAWQDIATGRSTVATRHGYTDWSAQGRCEEELFKIKSMGIKLDLLFNGNCYGEYAISERNVDHLWALEKNTKAIAFYQRHGFRMTGDKKFEEDTTEYLVRMER